MQNYRWMLLLFAVMAAGAASEERTLTLREAVDLALKQNPDLALARLAEGKAEQGVRLARDPFVPKVAAGIRANRQFHESFADGGVFPAEFLQQLEVAEMAGATTESLLRLAQEYEDRAKNAIRVLTGIATVATMLLVFGLIIFAIISMAWHLYMKPIYDTLDSINSADPTKPTVKPVPYVGVQFVAIPEFQGLGTTVGQLFSAALAGQMSVDDALKQAQDAAKAAMTEGGYIQ